MISEARHTIEKLDEVIKKVTSPANRIGTYLGSPNKETAQIVVGGSDYYCNVDPRINISKLKKGTRVLVNEAYVIVGDLGYDLSGPVTKITELLGTDRLRVGMEHGMQSVVLQRCQDLMKETLKVGDEIRVDPNYRIAIEVLSQSSIGRVLPRNGARVAMGESRRTRRKLSARSRMRSNCPFCTRICSRNFSTRHPKDSFSTDRPVAARR